MPEEIENSRSQLIALTADIVSAYVSNNPVPVASLPELIESVNSSLAKVGQSAEPETPPLVPAVNPKRSIFPDYIICLEDGKKFKALKRHLMSFGLTPNEYREKWGLPHNYPMVAPSYAAQRSTLAKASGLGRKPAAKPVRGAGKKRSPR
ncbi:MucR family transcriptional regulator [Mesorhizobium sp.]|uniref:MucR family transcriptional regulator n=1 Tax=Mesorhizobium sp. TaxID=1871066 RepID=UPI000FE4E3BE|nr:MucR family transcriptional regulator [Mesorhizobium sp.]RWD74269.1 MAG: transcriptional regulator [Mesorhizobium sp.]